MTVLLLGKMTLSDLEGAIAAHFTQKETERAGAA